MSGIRTHKSVVIGTDYTGSCKSNYHPTTTTTSSVVIEDSVDFKWSQNLSLFTIFSTHRIADCNHLCTQEGTIKTNNAT